MNFNEAAKLQRLAEEVEQLKRSNELLEARVRELEAKKTLKLPAKP